MYQGTEVTSEGKALKARSEVCYVQCISRFIGIICNCAIGARRDVLLFRGSLAGQ